MHLLIFHKQDSAAIVPVATTAPARFALHEVAELSGIPSSIIRDYCQLGLCLILQSRAGEDPNFDVQALNELRRLDHLRRRHGFEMDALPFVWNLLRRVRRLESELQVLRKG